MLKLITFNAAIQDVRIFGHSWHRPVDHIDVRLAALIELLSSSSADLVFLQELFHHDNQKLLLEKLEKHYPHNSGLARPGWKLRLGNELLTLSRYPLHGGKLVRFKQAPAEELRHTSRGFYHVLSRLPAIGKVNLVNFHMSAGGLHSHPESREMEAIRSRQIQQVIDYCRGLDNFILAGDLNAGPDVSGDNYRQLVAAGFCDLFSTHGAEGISWDPDNPLVKHGDEAHLPAQRIDHIFTDRKLFNKIDVIAAEIIFKEACIETETGKIPCSDHYGLSVQVAARA